MRPALRAVAPGHYVTIQDAGRNGWRRFGVSGCGAMDFPSLAAANALVGNPEDTPALEFAFVGGTWEVLANSARIAVAGGNFGMQAGGLAIKPWRSHTLRRGQVLQINGSSDSVWGYLAVAGGFDLVPQLGSCSTHLRSGLGGSRMTEGDTLALRAAEAPAGKERRLDPHVHSADPIRVVLGPQDDYFTPESVEAFLTASYRISHRSDRMGTWLDGPAIPHVGSFNLVSDGLIPGCIQIPGAGTPVVLMMDCQTIGGYPKLATIVSADLPRFAQMRAGCTVIFVAVEIEVAQRLAREHHASVVALPRSVRDVPDRGNLPFWLRAE
jgi:5-oxoprolinase (ATP-hydrolysing) subunit C